MSFPSCEKHKHSVTQVSVTLCVTLVCVCVVSVLRHPPNVSESLNDCACDVNVHVSYTYLLAGGGDYTYLLVIIKKIKMGSTKTGDLLEMSTYWI